MSPERGDVLVSLAGVQKDYHGLRPLRVQRLELRRAHTTAIVGLDQVTAEVLVNLITGASIPDTGDVRAFGQLTTEIADGDAWLTGLDQFGLMSERAVLLEQMTARQNLAVPLSLALQDLPEDVVAHVVRLAAETGIEASALEQRAADLSPLVRARIRLARALALGPLVLLAEHPTAPLVGPDVPVFAADFVRAVSARRLATLVLTADQAFARAVADEVLTLHPATGALTRDGAWRRWF